jgi:hypothetical protein
MQLCRVVDKLEEIQEWAKMAQCALDEGNADQLSEYVRRCDECASVLMLAMPLVVDGLRTGRITVRR